MMLYYQLCLLKLSFKIVFSVTFPVLVMLYRINDLTTLRDVVFIRHDTVEYLMMLITVLA